MEILYEDKNILICKKPVGIVSQHTDAGDGLADEVQKYCGYAGIVHRLDTAVGGAIVFGKNKNAASKLSTLVTENKLGKKYIAVVHGCPAEKSGIFKDLLFKDSGRNKSFVVKRMRKGVKEASLEYKVIASAEYENQIYSLVEIKLHTGRTHQIRVQFSSRKTPICGDIKYGSKVRRSEIALFSHSISFCHPVTEEILTFTEYPTKIDYPWNLFGSDLGE